MVLAVDRVAVQVAGGEGLFWSFEETAKINVDYLENNDRCLQYCKEFVIGSRSCCRIHR